MGWGYLQSWHLGWELADEEQGKSAPGRENWKSKIPQTRSSLGPRGTERPVRLDEGGGVWGESRKRWCKKSTQEPEDNSFMGKAICKTGIDIRENLYIYICLVYSINYFYKPFPESTFSTSVVAAGYDLQLTGWQVSEEGIPKQRAFWKHNYTYWT